MDKKILNLDYSQPEKDSDDIDLKILFNFLIRNKYLISTFAILFSIIFLFYSNLKKKIWEGRFQIVLESGKNNSSAISSSISGLPGLNNLSLNQTTPIKTEVAILESPSVLMPIFNYVNNQKGSDSKLSNFFDWKKRNLSVELVRGTSILNISYRDLDKETVLPVLKRISNKYQQYSGEGKKRNMELTRLFLNNQIQIYKEKSNQSFKNVQQYAIEQDLTVIDSQNQLSLVGRQQNLDIPNGNVSLSNLSIETVRVNAANKIRNIDNQIKKIQDLKNNSAEIQYISSSIPYLIRENLPKELEKIETKLVELRSKYKDKDFSIIKTIEKRDSLIKLLQERAIGYLKAERIVTEALMESATRPKGVLTKYKELIRNAGRDEVTLIDLENKLKALQIEDARIEDPWKLITQPTLIENPVGPNRKNYGVLGIISGLFFGLLISLLKEKKYDLIYDEKTLENLLSISILDKLKIKNNLSSLNEELTLLEYIVDNNSGQDLFLIVVGDMKKYLNEIKILIYKKFDERKIKFILEDNIAEVSNDNILILLASTGLTTFENINLLKKRLFIAKKSLFGVILLDKRFLIN